MGEKDNKFKIVLAAFFIIGAVMLTLFKRWEPSEETWGYWLFARIFAETGKFIIVDRGPLYILYLSIFRWMGFPFSVIVEYTVTSLILAASLVVLFRKYIGLFWAVFAAILWMPFLQISEPPTQNLALACVSLVVAIRGAKVNRFRLAVSYALLGMAYMFRSTYMVAILIFAIWDIVKTFRQMKFRNFIGEIRPKLQDWPIFLVLILLIWFSVMQSPHPWNNGSFADTRWFPSNAKAMASGAFLQGFNWAYIIQRYGSFKDKDFYFTNQELFNGADDIIGAIRANPRFVAMQIARNINATISKAVDLTMLPRVHRKFSQHGPEKYFYYGIALLTTIPFAFLVLYGAFRACKSETMVLFVIANIFIAGVSILVIPKPRYLVPLIPVLILSAFWYGRRMRDILMRTQAQSEAARWLLSAVGCISIPVVFIFLSNGAMNWGEIIRDIKTGVSENRIRIMERREPYSLTASFKSLEPLALNCKGVLSLEHKFIGAFMDMPLSNVHDVWEIPPFGHFGDSDYKGLYPDRIDCILISNDLATGIGCATNYQIRYQNYIKPYAKYLENRGAELHNIREFGQVIVLPR